MSKNRQRGATLLEGALTLLVLFTFLFAIIEFGRAYNVYQAMTDAAREGARFAVSPCSVLNASGCTYGAGTLPTSADVQNKVQAYLDTAIVKNATVSVTQVSQTVNSVPWTYTKVQVSDPYRFIFFPFSITLNTQAVMRNENN